MKPTFIIGNWKSLKTTTEANAWFDKAEELLKNDPIAEHKTVVISVPFTLLPLAKERVAKANLKIFVGAQDVSPYDAGAYTGGVNVQQVGEFATHVLIGHSERRQFFGETPQLLEEKVKRVGQTAITPIFLVRSLNDAIPLGVTIVGYEPVEAIGSGRPDTPENANNMAKQIKERYPFVEYVLYGGSVTAENVAQFTQCEYLNGVVPGRASLAPEGFFALVHNA